MKDLHIRYKKTSDNDWVATRENGDTVLLAPVKIESGLIPDVRGMTLRDAIYLLENSGLKVKYVGQGKVRRQSPEHGARVYEGSVVYLDLNM
jgi:cell division protein FtsI (penicillin-binding protein 3)